jgi:hypothetical protein
MEDGDATGEVGLARKPSQGRGAVEADHSILQAGGALVQRQ